MAMGYNAINKTIIEWEELGKLGLKSYEVLAKAIDKSSMTLNDIVYNYYFGLCSDFDKDDIYHDIVENLETMLDEFQEVYELVLEIGYHNNEFDGSCYDDIDGAYFAIWGIYQLSPEAQKLKEVAHFDEKRWVEFG